MKLQHKLTALAFAGLILFSLTSCKQPPNELPPDLPGQSAPSIAANSPVPIGSAIIEQPNSPVVGETSGEYDCSVTFTGESANVSGTGVTVKDNIITVTKAGKYLFSGNLTGQLQVNTDEDAEVLLYLNGVGITGDKNAAIYILSAPKRVTLFTVTGSKNILTDADSYQYDEEADEPSACLYSKDDLHLDGEGELYISSAAMKGIYSKDDLKILSGTIQVTSSDDGIRGKDSLIIAGGNITVVSGCDAMKASGDPEKEKGVFMMTDGEVHLEAKDDGIDAAGKLTVLGGHLAIRTGEGSADNQNNGNNDFGFGGGHRPTNGGWGGKWDQNNNNNNNNNNNDQNTDGKGDKGIKSDTEILLAGGNIEIDSYDDAVHAADEITISGGTLIVSAGDDGIHCDKNIIISDGSIRVTDSYEGIEGQYITVSGGTIHVAARDDGFNATDGSASGGMGGRPGGFGSGQDALITISGGYIFIDAAGDGLDSNGDIKQTGGTAIVYGPSDNGNGALDTGDGRENGYFMEGGTLLAIGSSGMAEVPETTVMSILSVRTSTISSGTSLYILDKNGNCVVAFETTKSISSIIFASDRVTNEQLTVYSGGTLPTLTDHVTFFPEKAPTGGNKLQTR